MTKENKKIRPSWDTPPTFGKVKSKYPIYSKEYDFVFRGEHPKTNKK